MTLWTNNFNGIASGTTITTANSGGTSGTAFSAVSVPAGGTLTADSVAAQEGATGMRIVMAAGSSTISGPRWTMPVTTVGTRHSLAFWFRFAAYPAGTATTDNLFIGGGISTSSIKLGSDGRFSATAGGTSADSTVATAGTWYFIQYAITSNATAGAGRLECRITSAAGVSLLNADISATATSSPPNTNFGRLSTNSLAADWSYDSVAVSDALTSGFPGDSAPVPTAFTGTAAFTGTGELTSTGVALVPVLATGTLTGAGVLSTATSAVAPPAPPAGATPGIHVTPNPDAEPPRFEIELTTPDGSMIQSVTLLRTVNGVTSPTRVQPNTGSSYQYVEDYEEPWDVDVTYTATVTTGTGTATYNASPYQLSSANAWAIHPLTPALSVCIDSPGATYGAAVTAVDAITRGSNVTRHDILGSSRPIVTKAGNRSSSEGTMHVAALTSEVEDRIWTLVDDQTPLLIQFPPAWNTHFEFGYYDLGDVAADRFGKLRNEPVRLFTLPFLRVDAPAGTQQSTWTYAQLLHDFATYAAVTAAYVNYPALLTDERR